MYCRTGSVTGVQWLLLFSAILHMPFRKRLVRLLGFAPFRNGARNHGRTVASVAQWFVAGPADRAGLSAVRSSATLAPGGCFASLSSNLLFDQRHNRHRRFWMHQLVVNPGQNGLQHDP